MKFLKLKPVILIALGYLAISFTFISCSGEDGTNGVNGNDGVGIESTVDNGDGTFTINYSDGSSFTTGDLTGNPGNDGAPGDDGNANVLRGTLPLEDPDPINDNRFSFNLLDDALGLGLSQEEIDNYAYFFYLKDKFGNINSSDSRIAINGSDRYTRITYTPDNGNVRCFFYTLEDDTPYFDWDGNNALDIFIVVAIEITLNGKSGERSNPVNELKNVGVDVNDYYALLAYFGLKE
ncbi:hypothetical protein [Flagellimonas sp.]|uniref:hypothetical protein n=1 Tax=Flagellimonas sp. TaxID=2058762 RepID=UPI003B511622